MLNKTVENEIELLKDFLVKQKFTKHSINVFKLVTICLYVVFEKCAGERGYEKKEKIIAKSFGTILYICNFENFGLTKSNKLNSKSKFTKIFHA